MAWTDPADWTHLEIVTNTKLNTHLRDNMRELWHELAYIEFTSPLNPATSEATPTDVVSAGAITYEAKPIVIEFYAPAMFIGANGATVYFNLWDATTDLGRIGRTAGSGTNLGTAVFATRRLTPTAASHTYKVRAWASAAGSQVDPGAGGAGAFMPGSIRIVQKGGT